MAGDKDKPTSQFGALLGNQGNTRAAIPPVEGAAEDLPDLPTPAPKSAPLLRLVSAQVPQELKFEFDSHILQAKKDYFPDLEVKEALAALLQTLQDERCRRVWLHKIAEGQDKG